MSDWILAIDTSTEACSCALGNGEQSYVRYTDVPRKHAEKVLPMVDELLEEAGIQRSDLKAIAFGRGPGAFTGLRIAASVVQGLAFALDLPVIPVSSLQALAQRGQREFNQENSIAAIDARMGELYWATYQLANNGLMEAVGDEHLTSPAKVFSDVVNADTEISWAGVGTGWQYQNEMSAEMQALDQVEASTYTHALDVLTIALPKYRNNEMVAVEQAIPTYIRNNVAHQKTPPKTK